MSTQQALATHPFFEACAHGKFLLQRCGTHGHLQYPPGPLCRRCGQPMSQWVESSGLGTVQAFSLVHRAPMPAFNAYLPYMVAVVQLQEGPLVETWLKRDGRTPTADEVAIGQSVRFGFEPINGQVVPVAQLK